jgi:hypothetical protein
VVSGHRHGVLGRAHAFGHAFDILGADPSARAGPPDGREIDAEASRELPDRRRRLGGTALGGTGDRLAVGGTERHQRRAHGDRVARGAVKSQDHARERRRDLDGRLGRFHLDQRLVQRHGVALGDEPLHDLGFLEAFSEIRQREHALVAHQYATTSRTAAAMRSTLGR